MVSLKLVRLIEEHSNELTEGLVRKLHSAPRTRSLRAVPANELRTRLHGLLCEFHTWLLTHADDKMQERYVELGRYHAGKNVTLPDLCWAMVLIKEHVWEFVGRQALHNSPVEIFGEFELLRFLDLFFDSALCCVTEGYVQVQHEAARLNHPAKQQPPVN